MSEPLRIALVAEGLTDGVVIEAALQAILCGRPFILKQIFPEGSDTFGEMGAGWVGVYRWCRQSARRGGAGDSYARGSITPTATDHPLPETVDIVLEVPRFNNPNRHRPPATLRATLPTCTQHGK